MTTTIRPEQPGDAAAIRTLTDDAFRDMPFSDGDEGPLVDRLRQNDELELSLVAVDPDGAIVGHIGFSSVKIAGASGPWFQLSPVSVIPARQLSGIGSQLIEAGMKEMAARGAQCIVLVGNPAYYSRFGFTLEHGLTLSEAMDPVLQIVSLDGEVPAGQITLASAFDF